MSKKRAIRRVREKIAKLSIYNEQARKTWGSAIASDMFREDLDFLNTMLVLLEKADEF